MPTDRLRAADADLQPRARERASSSSASRSSTSRCRAPSSSAASACIPTFEVFNVNNSDAIISYITTNALSAVVPGAQQHHAGPSLRSRRDGALVSPAAGRVLTAAPGLHLLDVSRGQSRLTVSGFFPGRSLMPLSFDRLAPSRTALQEEPQCTHVSGTSPAVRAAPAPITAAAQSSFTGVVRDTSGAVLPGVTVEAQSPVLIEGTKSAITDVRASTASSTCDRAPTPSRSRCLASRRRASRRWNCAPTSPATFNANLEVGALEESVTVTGASPVVDVLEQCQGRGAHP